jgi:hypothetical protein
MRKARRPAERGPVSRVGFIVIAAEGTGGFDGPGLDIGVSDQITVAGFDVSKQI